MKKILKEISREMNSQNNRFAQYPLFVVQELVESNCSDGQDAEFVKPYMEWEENPKFSWACEDDACEKYVEKCQEEGEIPEFDKLCSCCQQENGVPIQMKWEFDLHAGVFLTAKACEEHIKQNAYHYNKGRSYCIGAWRNPEMQEVMRHIADMDTGKHASFYD